MEFNFYSNSFELKCHLVKKSRWFDFRNSIWCATYCSRKYFCSAFHFDQAGNICQLGSLRTTTTTENQTLQIVTVHENLSYLSKGSDTIFYLTLTF